MYNRESLQILLFPPGVLSLSLCIIASDIFCRQSCFVTSVQACQLQGLNDLQCHFRYFQITPSIWTMAFIKSSFSSSAAFGWVDFLNHNFQRCASFGSFGRCPLCTHCAVLWWWLTWQWNRCSGSGACFFRTIRLTMAQVCRVCSKTQRNEFNQLFLKVANGVITFMWAAGSGGQH